MSWKKSIFSYVMWLLHTLLAATALVILIRALGVVSGGEMHTVLTVAAAVGLVAGMVVALLHMFVGGRLSTSVSGFSTRLLLEAVSAVLLLVLGLVLRLKGLPAAGEQVMYFEAARVVEGQAIPQVVHGATYIYLLLLRGFFLFLGNKFSVGIWLQIVLQLVTALLLFFGVRKLAGSVAALVSLFFFSCSGFAVSEAVLLSPRALFLLLFVVGLNMLCACKRDRLSPFLFFLCGLWMGVIGNLDVSGLLLAVFGIAIALSEWEIKPGGLRRTAAIALFFAGGAFGFGGAVWADAIISGKSVYSVVSAWLELYWPEAFQFSLGVNSNISFWGILIVVLVICGVYSFWCDRSHERLSVWAAAFWVTAAAECFRIFVEELPGTMYLYLFFAVLAGVSVQECFMKEQTGLTAENTVAPVKADGVKALKGETEDLTVREKTMQEKKDSISVEEKAEQEKKEDAAEKGTATTPGEKKHTRFIENPLPLPKPHQKKVLDYDRHPPAGKEHYDYPVDDNDDFDIK